MMAQEEEVEKNLSSPVHEKNEENSSISGEVNTQGQSYCNSTTALMMSMQEEEEKKSIKSSTRKKRGKQLNFREVNTLGS